MAAYALCAEQCLFGSLILIYLKVRAKENNNECIIILGEDLQSPLVSSGTQIVSFLSDSWGRGDSGTPHVFIGGSLRHEKVQNLPSHVSCVFKISAILSVLSLKIPKNC